MRKDKKILNLTMLDASNFNHDMTNVRERKKLVIRTFGDYERDWVAMRVWLDENYPEE